MVPQSLAQITQGFQGWSPSAWGLVAGHSLPSISSVSGNPCFATMRKDQVFPAATPFVAQLLQAFPGHPLPASVQHFLNLIGGHIDTQDILRQAPSIQPEQLAAVDLPTKYAADPLVSLQ
jgi:hypothetical protein